MRETEKTGRTVEEAVDQAIGELGVSMEEVDVEIIDQPSKGFLGILGSRPARVKVTVKNTPSRKVRSLMSDILKAMDLEAKININENENTVMVNLEGESLGILIGRRGETLDALQYLLNLSVNKSQENRKKYILDIEGYRQRREETLKKLAHKLADKATQRGRNVVLEPMNSLERRIIHTALQERADISTFSEGEEPYRKIIIAPKK
ncbi:MAG: RNA-binding cell elongation regulator Jag/EloR [Bacillota bacterium]